MYRYISSQNAYYTKDEIDALFAKNSNDGATITSVIRDNSNNYHVSFSKPVPTGNLGYGFDGTTLGLFVPSVIH